MSSNSIKVKKDETGARLDVFLVEKFKEQSRSFWQKKIKSGEVLLNGKPAKVHQWLKEGDRIEGDDVICIL